METRIQTVVTKIIVLLVIMLLGACGGSGGSSASSSSSSTSSSGYTVGGFVSGLAGAGLVLQNNGGNDLSVTANGSTTFSAALPSGSSYNITIKSQPSNPSQTCSLAGSVTGTITNANIAAVSVNCVTNSFVVGATITGLTGTALVLQNNAGDDITVDSNGVVTFPVAIASGAQYAVTIKRQPVARSPLSSSIQFCSVSGGSGVVGSGPVNNVTVNCRPATARFLYVPNTGDNTLSGFAVNAATGALTPIAGSPFQLDFAMDASTFPAATHPFGAALYIYHPTITIGSTTSSGFSAFNVDPVTGVLTAMSGSPFATGGTSTTAFYRSDPTGRFFYMTNYTESKTYIFKADRNTGSLTSGPLVSVNAPTGPFYDASGNFVFESPGVVSSTNGPIVSISSYLIDPTTGEKIAISTASSLPVINALAPHSPINVNMALDSTGTRLYYSYSRYSCIVGVNVNPITGQLSAMSGSPYSIGGVAPTSLSLHASGKFLHVVDRIGNTASALSIDSTNGVLTTVGSTISTVTTGGALNATTERYGTFMFPDNSALGVTRRGPTTPSSAGIYAINQSTGELTALPGSPFPVTGNKPESFFYEPSGKYAYLIDSGDSTITAYAINTSTGTRTFVGTYAVGPNPTVSPIVVGRQ